MCCDEGFRRFAGAELTSSDDEERFLFGSWAGDGLGGDIPAGDVALGGDAIMGRGKRRVLVKG